MTLLIKLIIFGCYSTRIDLYDKSSWKQHTNHRQKDTLVEAKPLFFNLGLSS
jgi:hypothetical protein